MNDPQLFWLGILAIAVINGLSVLAIYKLDCRRERFRDGA